MIFVFSQILRFYNRDSSQLFLFFIPGARNRRNKDQVFISSYVFVLKVNNQLV